MAVEKRGRPRKTAERRAETVAAFLECIGKQGLRKTTMGAVASEVGLDRSTLHHYFPSRDELVSAAMEHVIEVYRAQIEALVDAAPTPPERISRLLDHAFIDDWEDPRLGVILSEFFRASFEDEQARKEIQRAYRAFENAIRAELKRAHPKAPAAEIKRVACAIALLAEGLTSFAEMGLESGRATAARATAEQLVQQLGRRRAS